MNTVVIYAIPQDQPFSVNMCMRAGNLQAESGLFSWRLQVLCGTDICSATSISIDAIVLKPVLILYS